jgi:hypothetical protein
MKRVLRLSVVIALVWILGGPAIAQDKAATDDQRQAMAILQTFLDAQVDGRPEVIKQLLGGELLEKRSPLLENPAYAAFMREAYAGARYEMVDWQNVSMNSIQIDVRFDSSDQDAKRIRYILTRNPSASDGAPPFLIYSQTEITR